MSKIIAHRRVANYLKKLPRDRKNRVKKALEQVGKDPLGLPGVIQMAGEWAGYHRIRLGNMRIIFWFDYEKKYFFLTVPPSSEKTTLMLHKQHCESMKKGNNNNKFCGFISP